MATSLKEEAQNKSMVINHEKMVKERHICCTENLRCCQVGDMQEFIQNTKNRTRSKLLKYGKNNDQYRKMKFLTSFLIFVINVSYPYELPL